MCIIPLGESVLINYSKEGDIKYTTYRFHTITNNKQGFNMCNWHWIMELFLLTKSKIYLKI